ncbi:sensor histidine kinase [Streptomyces sp. NPDC002920]
MTASPRRAAPPDAASPERIELRAVACLLAAVLVLLGAAALLPTRVLSHQFSARTDREIEKFRKAGQSGGLQAPMRNRTDLPLLLDITRRVTERHAGASKLPAIPALAPSRSRAYAGHRDCTFRVLALRTQDSGLRSEGGYVSIARSTEDTDRATTRLLQAEAAVALLLAAGMAVALQLRRRDAKKRHESERRLREFLASAGHELRNPLTVISGYTAIARTTGPVHDPVPSGAGVQTQAGEGIPPYVREEALRRVTIEVARMTSLIDELLLLSRLDLGQEPRARRVNLALLCREAVETERTCHPAQPVRLLIAPGEHTATGDPLQLHQVVTNLLANARLHTPDGTTTTLGLGTEGDYRVIEVTDDGPGVPAELRSRIFDRFTRGNDAAARGSGLGLSIVAAVAAAHGGTATLEPSDRGAWFRVRLPAAP